MTKSTISGGMYHCNDDNKGRRWTSFITREGRITPPLTTTTISKSIMDSCSNISLYSTCILIILSSMWSPTCAGMTTNRTMITQGSHQPLNEPHTTTTDIPSILARSASDRSHHLHTTSGDGHQEHKCYVCLPPNKSSREAQEIFSLFPEGEQTTQIPDCASFSPSTQKMFEFTCPQNYRGCLLRIHGSNVSRSCAKFQLNDCKTANSVEFCYCSGSLCNGKNPSSISAPIPPGPPPSESDGIPVETDSEEKAKIRLADEQEEAESRKFWQKGETDDEDLLEMQDDTGSSGDGEISVPGGAGVYPPGVIDAYTTTPKPTLVPNLRGDSRSKTTTPPASGGSNFVPHKFIKASSSISTSPLILCSFLILSSYHHFLVNRP